MSDHRPTDASPSAGDTGAERQAPASAASAASVVTSRGLRPFDRRDARFYPQLLPGPRDQHGLPDSLRFWLDRITGPAERFRVGLIYGPSGCGKSSFVHAGLLPQLGQEIETVVVQATADHPPSHLADLLPGGSTSPDSLPSALQAVRQTAEDQGRRVLLIIDQLEQWLHHPPQEEQRALVEALRQCDGHHLQAVVTVRDDFWMDATRFFRDVDVPLVEGRNAAPVELLDRPHAQRVLQLFGVACAAWPDGPATEACSESQQQFLSAAMDHVAENDRVLPLRLMLLVETLQGRSWKPATLRRMLTAADLGVTLLEHHLGGSAAAGRRRLGLAAERLLASLLPPSGDEIRGRSYSVAELRQAARADSSLAFRQLLELLDQQLRLISPVAVAAADPSTDDTTSISTTAAARYQLTHDGLVPSVRHWVRRRREQTLAGRLRDRFAARTQQYQAQPIRRHLPAVWEDIVFRCWSSSHDWSPPQRQMMHRSGQRVWQLLGLACLTLVAVLFAAREVSGRTQAHALSDRILDASTSELPGILNEAVPWQTWLVDRLARPLDHDSAEPLTAAQRQRRQLHWQLSNVRLRGMVSDELFDLVLSAPAADLASITQIMDGRYRFPLSPLWQVLDDARESDARRLRAATVLAELDPAEQPWSTAAPTVARLLVDAPAEELPAFVDGLQPVKDRLSVLLPAHLGRDGSAASLRRAAAIALAEFLADDPVRLTQLAREAEPLEFAALAPAVIALEEEARDALRQFRTTEAARKRPDNRSPQQALRAASTAALEIALGDGASTMFQESAEPAVRSYLISQYARSGGSPAPLLQWYQQNPGRDVRFGLLLALGQLPRDRYTQQQHDQLITLVQQAFRSDPDAGVHAAAGWCLQQQGQNAWVADTRAALAGPPSPDRPPEQRWYVTPMGLTMVRIDGPFDIRLGSDSSDSERYPNEARVWRHCGRSLDIAAHEITAALFQQFLQETGAEISDTVPPAESLQAAQIGVPWNVAIWFCNWLSEKEGIPRSEWCYQPNADGEYRAGLVMVEDGLQKQGYRLPTHYEWEYVARAGTSTSRYFGNAPDLLSEYAWYDGNSDTIARPVGLLKPTPWGAFDILGNASEWCLDQASPTLELPRHRESNAGPANRTAPGRQPGTGPSAAPSSDQTAAKSSARGALIVNLLAPRRVRGGSLQESPRFLRSARRSFSSWASRDEAVGLRVVRTTQTHDEKPPVLTGPP